MSIIDVLVAIIVVTILVTILLGVVTYVAYKLRLARRPTGGAGSAPEPRYFRLHLPSESVSDPSSPDAPGGLAAEEAGEAIAGTGMPAVPVGA